MVRGVLVEPELFAQRDRDAVEVLVADLATTVGADELHGGGDAFRLDGGLELGVDGDALVYGVLRHLAVRRPLAAGDGHEVARHDVDDVVARELLRVARVCLGVAHKRADSGPGGADGGVVDRIAQHAVALAEDKVDLGKRRARLEGDLAHRVRRAGDRRALPRQQVEDAPVLGEPDHARLGRGAVVGQDQVGARRGHHDLLAAGVGHLAHLVGEDAARVDHRLCAHVVRLACHHVAHLGAADLVVRLAESALRQQPEHLGVVLHLRARLDCGERDAEVHARVVLLAVVDHEAPLEVVALRVLCLHRRELEKCLGARDEVRRGHRAPVARDQVVELTSHVHHGHLPPLEKGHHHGDRVRHEGRRLDHVGTLGEVVGDDHHVLVVVPQVAEHVEQRVGRNLRLEGLREVADAAVDQLGGARRGARREVLPLDERGLQAARRRVHGDARARRAAANHEHVELLRLHRLLHLLARRRRPLGHGHHVAVEVGLVDDRVALLQGRRLSHRHRCVRSRAGRARGHARERAGPPRESPK
mmetsp:Transcript_21860/g.55459  ORF Transcript_21860/g.55459 Transcript_21860/m.55459 type:complete len:532 (+) Transcript_21860:503-2098(+)